MKKQTAARIKAAAIRDTSGTVWYVPRPGRHHDVIAFMRRAHYRGPVAGPGQQGFILEDGSFVTREQALPIARAAKQLKGGKTIAKVLTSEDLW